LLKRQLGLNYKIQKARLVIRKGMNAKNYLMQEDEDGNRVEEDYSSLWGLFNQ